VIERKRRAGKQKKEASKGAVKGRQQREGKRREADEMSTAYGIRSGREGRDQFGSWIFKRVCVPGREGGREEDNYSG
jgi:hypothetical protein